MNENIEKKHPASGHNPQPREEEPRRSDFRSRLAAVKPTRWVRFGIVSLLFLLFVIWIGNYWLLLLWFLLVDIYITAYIPWGWWKKKKGPVRSVMAWVDAIVYALILVYIIFAFIGQNYKIPSSSLEKSLLVGDFLWVNKAVYGPRVPNTPLHFPLADHTMPIVGGKSYIENPQLPYHRLPGLRWVERGDIVVFNFPEGDTIFSRMPELRYYEEAYNYRSRTGQDPVAYFEANKARYGDLIVRPVDRKDAYVKRAIGLPGEWLQLRGDTVYINDRPLGYPTNVQFNYIIPVNNAISDDKWLDLGVRYEDHGAGPMRFEQYLDGKPFYRVPLTQAMLEQVKTWPEVAGEIVRQRDSGLQFFGNVWPLGTDWEWTISDTGKFWIPQKGKTIHLTANNLPLYRRAIETYEGNKVEVKDGKIYVNGQDNPYYTFKYDYFWMMGDNRDNSLDSRYFGLVPEDHIIGTPMRILISLDEERGLMDGKIRWERILANPNPDKAAVK